LNWAGLVAGCLLAGVCFSRAGDDAFTNSLAQGELAAARADLPAAVEIYARAEHAESTNAVNLCALSRRYCDLAYLEKSPAAKKDMVDRALACALAAVKAGPTNSTAHACVAVCYAKECGFADIKDELNDSRLFKLEAERAIALDPKQDIAYYLLGRWNYGMANVGMFSRAFVQVVYGGLPKASNQDAIADFKQAIALAPDRIINHAGLAMVYEAVGDKRAEIAELEKCRALKPTGLEDQDAQRDALRTLAGLEK